MHCSHQNRLILVAMLFCVLLMGSAAHAQEGAAESAVDEPDGVTEQAADEPRDVFIDRINAQISGEPRSEEGGLTNLFADRTGPLATLGRWVISVCLVVALILILAYAARRFGGRSPLLAGADLGHVLGRVYLNRQAALYFVDTGGRMLVIGVTNNTISLVSEFDSEVFAAEEEGGMPSDAESFLSQLEQSAGAMRSAPERSAAAVAPAPVDKDMSNMKAELERMRRMLADD